MLTYKLSEGENLNTNTFDDINMKTFGSVISEGLKTRLFILTDVIRFGTLINTLRRTLENKQASDLIYGDKDEKTLKNMEKLIKLVTISFGKIVTNKNPQNDHFSQPTTDISTEEEYLNSITLIRNPTELSKMLAYIKGFLLIALVNFDDKGNTKSKIVNNFVLSDESKKETLEDYCREVFSDIKDLLDGKVSKKIFEELDICLAAYSYEEKWHEIKDDYIDNQEERIKTWPFI